MPDNWGFVLTAYLLTAAAFAGYWRRLCRRERQLLRGRSPSAGGLGGPLKAPHVLDRLGGPSRPPIQ